jgi:hypothetical protein
MLLFSFVTGSYGKNIFYSNQVFIIFCFDNEERLILVFTVCCGKKFPVTGCGFQQLMNQGLVACMMVDISDCRYSEFNC